MPRLLRAIGRTAVIAGTATVVSGRVQRRQARRFGASDPAPVAAPEQDPQETAEPQSAPSTDASSTNDTLEQLKELGELKAGGVLTEQEFAAQKAKILAA